MINLFGTNGSESNQQITLFNAQNVIKGNSILKGYEGWTRLGGFPTLAIVNSMAPQRGSSRIDYNVQLMPLVINFSAANADPMFFHAMTTGATLGTCTIVVLGSSGIDLTVTTTLKILNTYVIGYSHEATQEGANGQATLTFDGYELSYDVIKEDQTKEGHDTAGFSQSLGIQDSAATK